MTIKTLEWKTIGYCNYEADTEFGRYEISIELCEDSNVYGLRVLGERFPQAFSSLNKAITFAEDHYRWEQEKAADSVKRQAKEVKSSREKPDYTSNELYAMAIRCAGVIEHWTGKKVNPNTKGLELVADFCFAIGVRPEIHLVPIEEEENKA